MCSLSVNINVHVSYIFVCLLNINEATYFPSLVFQTSRLQAFNCNLQPTSILTSDHSFEHSPRCARLSSSPRLTSLKRVTSPTAQQLINSCSATFFPLHSSLFPRGHLNYTILI